VGDCGEEGLYSIIYTYIFYCGNTGMDLFVGYMYVTLLK